MVSLTLQWSECDLCILAGLWTWEMVVLHLTSKQHSTEAAAALTKVQVAVQNCLIKWLLESTAPATTVSSDEWASLCPGSLSWHFAVSPRLTLYCDDHGNPVCKAVAGKPAARISWVLESSFTPREEGHDNGTVTVVSKFTAYGSNVTNATCFMSHPAGNQSNSIACRPSGKLPFVHSAFKPCLASCAHSCSF